MPKPVAPFTLRLDPELKDRLRKLAERENRSLANMIETLLQRGVDQSCKHYRAAEQPQ